MNDSKKELVAELRRLADYAEGKRTATDSQEAEIDAAISFLLDQPFGNSYTEFHALVIATLSERVADELERLHASTVDAHRRAVEDGSERDHHALATAARTEAGFVEAIAADRTRPSEYRKYPQDPESLDLLEAAAKLKNKLIKSNPKITNAEVFEALLDEPDGNETSQQKNVRLKRRARVWHGKIKNGKRINATATPENRLNTKEREKQWNDHFKSWGKNLSAYLKGLPAS